jgi:hypothetical protein
MIQKSMVWSYLLLQPWQQHPSAHIRPQRVTADNSHNRRQLERSLPDGC